MSDSKGLQTVAYLIKSLPGLSWLAKRLAYYYVRLLFASYHLTVTSGRTCTKPVSSAEGVYYFWHKDMLAAMYFFYTQRAIGHCIIDAGTGGSIMGYIAKRLGFKTIITSRNSSNIRAMRKACDALEINRRMCIVGDGAQGPAIELQPTAAYLAAKAAVPLVHLECSTKSKLVFNTLWSKLYVPLPFSQIDACIHKPTTPTIVSFRRASSQRPEH